MYYNGNSVAVPAPAGSPAISVYNNISFDCKNVDLYYGSFQALKGINLRIEKNQITALIGPSGCGKSTFLRSLNRMNDLIPSCRVEGEILLAGSRRLRLHAEIWFPRLSRRRPFLRARNGGARGSRRDRAQMAQ